ncbi:oleosin 1-like [Telopea speciosissima]|uniref:oleosin 1-like n=1 Tax=Telopea speciosissima TaxID=54955 RepID=UPI001CC7DF5E|nr:oleosin 1-like [Telopea speciosissima]
MDDRDQPKSLTQKSWESAPSSRQTVKFLTAVTIGTTLSFLSGLTLTGTVIFLVIATPVLVLFSPILVPAGIVILLAATGFLLAGGFGAAALSALIWIYDYVTGKNPPGSDQLDYARFKLAGKARDVKDRAKEYGQYGQQRAKEYGQYGQYGQQKAHEVTVES